MDLIVSHFELSRFTNKESLNAFYVKLLCNSWRIRIIKECNNHFCKNKWIVIVHQVHIGSFGLDNSSKSFHAT